jgi:autophagy-related protein 13
MYDSEDLSHRTSDWRAHRIEDGLPPPLTIEMYLDLADLTSSQSLVVVDDQGKRWDVADSLRPPMLSNARPQAAPATEVVLERWVFEIDDVVARGGNPDDEILSNVYKRCIPVFRSLYSCAVMLPVAKYGRGSKSTNPMLKLKYRIFKGRPAPSNDLLRCALYPGPRKVVDAFNFGPLQCPAGTFKAFVEYRMNCDFRVEDSEEILSSHFMGMDDQLFRPSLAAANPVGSAPTANKFLADQDPGQTYGSLSTFHNVGRKTSTSPISALRAITDADRTPPRDKASPQTRPPNQRRTSVSFQPFKAGPVTSSPSSQPPASPSSAGRTPTQTHRTRPSITTLPQAMLRTPIVGDTAIASSTSSSPKPAPIASRYSSSFSHRRGRFSSGASKGDDDGSSGKPSPTSSAQPGSDLQDGRVEPGSSGSVQQTDDEHVKDFLKLLESKKELKSFSRSDSSQNASMRRTTAALAKYQKMKDSNKELTDSMSSSFQLKVSSSSSSRGLANVPPMVPGSFSTGSSPGKAVSPHTPHTPAIPSRLSAVNYGPEPRRSRSGPRTLEREEPAAEEASDATPRVDTGSTAIPIPTSPRLWLYGRRSSSVNQRHVDDEPEYVLRSASLPAAGDERAEFNLAEELGQLQIDDAPRAAEELSSATPSPLEEKPEAVVEEPPRPRRTVYSATPDPVPFGRSHQARLSGHRGGSSRRGDLPFVHSYSPSSSGGQLPSGGSGSGGGGSGSAAAAHSGHSAEARTLRAPERGGARAVGGAARAAALADDDGDFIFTMSELGGRKSLEGRPGRGF